MDNNLTRFVESVSIDNKLIKEIDGKKFKESISDKDCKLLESKEINSETSVWIIPISRYNVKNANGRIYPRLLWEHVIEDQRDTYYGAPCLVDHPSDDSSGDPSRICGVWVGIDIDDDPNEGFVYGYLIPSGRLGEDIRQHVKNHLRCGVSSSGYGRLLSDNETVDAETFTLERPGDIVLNPSQQVYFGIDETGEGVKNISPKLKSSKDSDYSYNRYNPYSVNESTNNTETISDNHTQQESWSKNINDGTATIDNNKQQTIIKENNKVVKDSKIAKLEEKKFRRDMESFLEEAAAIKDPQERLQEFREIESYLEDGACPDLREKIEQKIAEEEEYIKAAIKEKSELKEKFDVDNIKGLEEKITKIVEDKTLLEQDARDWKKVSESLQNKLNETKRELDDRPTQAFVEYLNTKVDTLKSSMEEVSQKAYTLVKKFSESNKNYKKEVASLNEKIKGLEAEKAEMFDELKQAHANAASSNAIAEKAEMEKKNSTNSLKAMTESYNNLRAYYEKAVLDIKSLKEEKDCECKKRDDENESLRTQIDELTERNNALLKIIADQRSLIEKKDAKEQELNERVERQKKQLSEMASSLKNSQFELYGEKTKEARKVKVEGSPIVNYYENLYENYGNAVVPFKEKILKSRTLLDAQNTFYTKILPLLEESREINSMRLPENTNLKEKMDKMPGFNPNKGRDAFDNLPEGWL